MTYDFKDNVELNIYRVEDYFEDLLFEVDKLTQKYYLNLSTLKDIENLKEHISDSVKMIKAISDLDYFFNSDYSLNFEHQSDEALRKWRRVMQLHSFTMEESFLQFSSYLYSRFFDEIKQIRSNASEIEKSKGFESRSVDESTIYERRETIGDSPQENDGECKIIAFPNWK